ncbi:Ubiquitin-conjugating enzyme E2 11 [Saitoella coloradoensis]
MDAQNTAPSPADPAPTNKMAAVTQKAPDGHSVTKRLQQELMTLMMSQTPGVSAFPEDGNLLQWAGTIQGPEATYYEGMTFKIRMVFPANYPYAPPNCTFTTPMYHPNIDMAGRICLDILQDKWSAAHSIESLLLSLQSLLAQPNNASPLNGQAAELWGKEDAVFREKVLARFREGEK